ncbi:uncharacterized protein [Malus domestica]
MYRPQLESSLEEQGITWTVDVDNKSTTVSVIGGDQRIIDKASQILELMAKSTADQEVILQIIDGSQQHVNLRLWNKGGLCMKFGCEEEASLKWQEWLKGPSMKEIAEKMQCKCYRNYERSQATYLHEDWASRRWSELKVWDQGGRVHTTVGDIYGRL